MPANKTDRITIRVLPSWRDYLIKWGGSVSKGVRVAIEEKIAKEENKRIKAKK